MKKYRNFILVVITSGIIGGIIGGISNKVSSIDLTFGGKINNYLFNIFLAITLIIILYLIITLIHLKKNYKEINIEEIPKIFDREVTNAIHYSTIQLIIGLIWDCTVINKSFDKELIYLIVFPTMSIIIAVVLQAMAMKYYNFLYPDRKFNMFENKADKKFFNKLDEGEKWVIFSCAYATFKKMQFVYIVVIVGCMLLSLFTDVPIILPIMIGILWIIQISTYIFETRKYD